MCFNYLGIALFSLPGIQEGTVGIWSSWGHYYEPFSALNWSESNVGIGLCQSCPSSLILFLIFTDKILWQSWGEDNVSELTSELHLHYLQMMWLYWHYQTVTFGMYGIGLQPSVKWPG